MEGITVIIMLQGISFREDLCLHSLPHDNTVVKVLSQQRVNIRRSSPKWNAAYRHELKRQSSPMLRVLGMSLTGTDARADKS